VVCCELRMRTQASLQHFFLPLTLLPSSLFLLSPSIHPSIPPSISPLLLLFVGSLIALSSDLFKSLQSGSQAALPPHLQLAFSGKLCSSSSSSSSSSLFCSSCAPPAPCLSL